MKQTDMFLTLFERDLIYILSSFVTIVFLWTLVTMVNYCKCPYHTHPIVIVCICFLEMF